MSSDYVKDLLTLDLISSVSCKFLVSTISDTTTRQMTPWKGGGGRGCEKLKGLWIDFGNHSKNILDRTAQLSFYE